MNDMNILYHVYISLVLICLIISLTAKNYPKKLWIYFLAVFVTDVYMYYGYQYCHYNIHAISMAFYSMFFLWYYREVFSWRLYKLIFSGTALISVICLFSISNPYDIKIIVLLILSFISFPLLWFHKEIKEAGQNKITDKNLFWVSSGMIVWVTFFIFKMIPLYFLYTEDRRFLLEIDLIFQYVNIIFYLLLLKSLFCKI